MVIWSWKVVMQSLHNMERFMEWLTCYCRTQTLSWCWQGMQRKHLSTHLTSVLSCLKSSMDLSALLDWGLYAGQPWLKKFLPNFLYVMRNFLSVLKCWGLNENLWWILSASCSSPHHVMRSHYQELREKVGVQWWKEFLLFEKNPWGTAPSFRWQKRDTAVGRSTAGRGQIK